MAHPDAKYTVLISDTLSEPMQEFRSILEQHGVKIAVARSGKEALAIVSRTPPDLLVLDMILPDMNGCEVCQHLKHHAETKEIPFIFLTESAHPGDIVKGFEAGAVDYITIPFTPEEVLARMFTHLALKRSRDTLMVRNQQLAEQNRALQERYALTQQDFSDTLRDREERFRSTFEQAAVGIAHAALSGRFLRVNQRFCDIVGYSQEEIQAHTFQEMTHPDDLDSDLVYVQQLLAGTRQTYSMEKRYIRKDGSIVWVNLTVSLARDRSEEPKYFIKVIEDISQRKQAEDALRTSEQQYRLLAERVADGIAIIQEGKLVFVNEALASMVGLPAEHLVGRPPVDLFQSADTTQVEELFEQLEHDTPDTQRWPILQYIVNREHREVWMEGRHSVFTWEGHPAVLIDLRDITIRKLREMAVAEERNTLRQENIQLRATMKERYRFGEIIGKSPAMQAVYELIIKAAASEKEVLIRGESGTGKELIARTVHRLSERQKRAFVPINCGAITESLFEREFFGHRKGAFTGADHTTHGFFDAAHRGTLFLDEVGELNLAMQVKLLRAIETGEYIPVGESTPRTTDVRIIAATNRNLPEMVTQAMMREDFFYRIHVIVITVPALRDRQEDIPLLIEHFLKLYSKSNTLPTLPGTVLEALYNYDWPGNIRQLQHTLYRYLTLGTLDFITPRSPDAFESGDVRENDLSPQDLTLTKAVEQVEKRVILNTLEQHRWHKTHVAATLGIPRSTLRRKMKKYGLT